MLSRPLSPVSEEMRPCKARCQVSLVVTEAAGFHDIYAN